LKLKNTIEIERGIIMQKKLLILSLSIAVLFVLSAPITPANAGGSQPINWQIAGTIVQLIDISIPLPGPPYSQSIGPHSLINLSAKGSPGPAKITLLSQAGAPPNSLECISSNYFPIAYFSKNDFVALFPDQSLLFASIGPGGGILCQGIEETEAEGTTYFTVDMIITGGKGRYEGAEGYFTGEGYGYLFNDTTLVGENGKLTGTINLP
jgi:hypothetical protein